MTGSIERQNFLRVARVDLQNGANTRYYVLDARGHARAMVDSTGSVTDYYEYDAWGNVLPGSYGSMPNPFKWNAAGGYQHIPFTGLYHVGAREYDPRTARWLQRDPIGIASGDPNVYRYCGNDPVNASDPDGLQAGGSQALNFLAGIGGQGLGRWIKTARFRCAHNDRMVFSGRASSCYDAFSRRFSN